MLEGWECGLQAVWAGGGEAWPGLKALEQLPGWDQGSHHDLWAAGSHVGTSEAALGIEQVTPAGWAMRRRELSRCAHLCLCMSEPRGLCPLGVGEVVSGVVSVCLLKGSDGV